MHQPALPRKFQEAPARAALNQMITKAKASRAAGCLTERELCEQLGVSRATLRAAALSCAQKIVRLAKERYRIWASGGHNSPGLLLPITEFIGSNR
jgi:DNA-binding FadR family transcriptional regulator